MGSGDSGTEIARRQFVQRSLANATAGVAAQSFDPLSPESVAARQRAARQMREGLNSSFGTSTRGTDLPQGQGLQGPKGEDPIIGGPTITTQTGTNAVDDIAAAEALRQKQLELRETARPSPGTYRF